MCALVTGVQTCALPISGIPVTAAYAGLRPASERKEYRLNTYPERRYASVGGIRSTGLSSALGLAREVEALLHGGWTPPALPAWPDVAAIVTEATPPWPETGHGGRAGPREIVTRSEIGAALAGPLAARTSPA